VVPDNSRINVLRKRKLERIEGVDGLGAGQTPAYRKQASMQRKPRKKAAKKHHLGGR